MNDRLYLIDVDGIEEEVRCAICENQIKTDKGCDGNCKYDESLFNKITMMLDRRIELLPFNQPEIVRCKDCQYWNKYSCGCPEHTVNCQDYYVGDIETEAEFFCGYADKREVNRESN